MDERTQGALLLAVGGIAVRLGVTDAALAYVKPGIQPLLTVSGLFLVVIGLLTVIRAFRGEPGGAQAAAGGSAHGAQAAAGGSAHDVLDLHGHADDGHGHQPGHGPGVAWLLTLPLLALLLIAPPPLGAFAANRQSDRPLASPAAEFGPLPAANDDGTIPLLLSDYTYRALYDEQRSLEGKTVRLTGFVTQAEEPGAAFNLTRFMLACCAADGQAINIVVRSDQPAPPVETWIELDGTWVPREGHEVGDLTTEPPLIQATAIREIEQPAQPYE